MYADHSLTPREAVRLCMLGTIASGAMRYSDLASSVRRFITRLSGPSLELMGPSIELLRHEGLVAPPCGPAMEDNPLLEITDAGRAAFEDLMTAPLRPASGLSKLVSALKFRFLHLLAPAVKAEQIALLICTQEAGLVRLTDLRNAVAGEPGHMAEWLDEEIARAESRLAWLEGLQARLDAPGA